MPTTDATPPSADTRPLDLTIFGVLFLLSAPMELGSIISTGWHYPVKFFGVVMEGPARLLLLWAQPLFHLVLGYGFLTRRRWAWYLALFYAADTLTSTLLGFATHGFGRIRMIFLVLLAPFVIYLVVRRRVFVR